MIKKVHFIKGYLSSYAFMVVIFSLPISRKIFTISLWFWVIAWLLDGNFKEKFSKKKYLAALPTLICLSSFFFISLFSLIWSENINRGAHLLTTQAGLLLIPFLFSFSNWAYPNFNYRNDLLRAFLAGLIMVSFYLLAISLIESLSIINGKFVFNPRIGRWENAFLHVRFSFIIHPSYFGMMILLGIAIVLIDLKEKLVVPYSNIFSISLLLFLLVILFLTSARASIIGLIFLLIFNFRKVKIPSLIKILISISLITLISVYIYNNSRFMHLLKKTFESQHELSLKELHKLDVRSDIWAASFKVIEQSPIIGTGIGDAQKMLNQEYIKNKYALTDKMNYNCHNQFIETQVSTGFIGLFILMAILFFPLILKQYWKKEYYLSFLIIVVCGFMFESILFRAWGIALFSVFYTLFTHPNPD